MPPNPGLHRHKVFFNHFSIAQRGREASPWFPGTSLHFCYFSVARQSQFPAVPTSAEQAGHCNPGLPRAEIKCLDTQPQGFTWPDHCTSGCQISQGQAVNVTLCTLSCPVQLQSACSGIWNRDKSRSVLLMRLRGGRVREGLHLRNFFLLPSQML